MRSIRGYHIHQRTGRVGAYARHSKDASAAISINVRSFNLGTSDLLTSGLAYGIEK